MSDDFPHTLLVEMRNQFPHLFTSETEKSAIYDFQQERIKQNKRNAEEKVRIEMRWAIPASLYNSPANAQFIFTDHDKMTCPMILAAFICLYTKEPHLKTLWNGPKEYSWGIVSDNLNNHHANLIVTDFGYATLVSVNGEAAPAALEMLEAWKHG